MGLLAPVFLAGVLAIALPVWLHRLQTKSSIRESFSSAMLLESSEQQIHVRKQLKYLLLLAFRIALLALLVLAFAQPFLNRPPRGFSGTDAGTHLVVVDTSVSMGRSGLFEQALRQAQRAIDSAPAGALIQLLAADDGLQILSDLNTDKSAASAALSALSVSNFRLDFGQFIAELDRYAESVPQPATLHFVSDYQASGMPLRFSDVVASNVAGFTPWVVQGGPLSNWSIEFVRRAADGLDIGIRGGGDVARGIDVLVRINGAAVPAMRVSGPGRQLLQFHDITFEPGDNRVEATVVADDDLQADNSWYSIVENDPPVPVPLLTAQIDGLAVTYLTAALESAANSAFRVIPMALGEFDPRVLSRYRWAVTDDIGALAGPQSSSLTTFLQDGGNLLAFTGERSLALESLPLSGHHLRTGHLDSGDRFLSIGQVDTLHPSLAATEGWHRVKVSRTVPVEITDDDRVLMRLENNEPFMLERRIGDGRLLLVLSSVDNSWNDLPLHPVFVGFMIEAAAHLSGSGNTAADFTTGDSLPLSLIGSASGQVVDPDGTAVLSLAGTAQAQQVRLDKSGIYEVYTPEGETFVAVNIDPRESESEALSDEVVARWRQATSRQDVMTNHQIVRTDAPPLELWHWLLLLVALVVIGESVLGNRYLTAKLRPG